MPDEKPIGRSPLTADQLVTILRYTGHDKLAVFFDHAVVHEKLLGDAELYTNCIINDSDKDPWRPLTATEIADTYATSTTSLRKINDEDAGVLWVQYELDCLRAAYATVAAQAKMSTSFVPNLVSIADIGTSTRQILCLFAYYVKTVIMDEGIRTWINSLTVTDSWTEIFEYWDWKAGGTGLWNVTGANHWKRMLREIMVMAASEPRIEQWDDYSNQDPAVLNRWAFDVTCKCVRIIVDKEFAPIFQTGKAMYNLASMDPKKIPANKMDINALKSSYNEKWKNLALDNLPTVDMPSGYTQLNGNYIKDNYIKGETLNDYFNKFTHAFTTHQSVIDHSREGFGVCEWKYGGQIVHVLIGKTFCSKCKNLTTSATGNLKLPGYGGNTSRQGYTYYMLGIDEKIAFDYFKNSDVWNPLWKAMYKYRKHRSFQVIPESFINQFDVSFEFYKTFNGYCDVEAPFPYFYDAMYDQNLAGESILACDIVGDFPTSGKTLRYAFSTSSGLDVNPISYFFAACRRDFPQMVKLIFHNKQVTDRVLKHRAAFWMRHMKEPTDDLGSEDYTRCWVTKSIYVDLIDSVSKDPVAMMGITSDVIRYENISAYYASEIASLWHKYGLQLVRIAPTISAQNVVTQDSRPHGLDGRESDFMDQMAEKSTQIGKWVVDLFSLTAADAPAKPPANTEKAASEPETPANNNDDDESG